MVRDSFTLYILKQTRLIGTRQEYIEMEMNAKSKIIRDASNIEINILNNQNAGSQFQRYTHALSQSSINFEASLFVARPRFTKHKQFRVRPNHLSTIQ